jgi:cytochrome c-type biogenesis protein CcmF
MGNVAEPDTRHFLDKDIYTHVTWAILEEDKKDEEEYGEPEVKNVKVGDTLYLKQSIVILDSVRRILPIDIKQVELQESDIAVEAKLIAWDFNTKKHTLRPLFIVKDTSEIYGLPDGIEDIGLKVSFNNINPKDGSIELTFIQKNVSRDFIVMQAIVFPYINLLWLGCFIMIIGTIIAIYSRVKFGK